MLGFFSNGTKEEFLNNNLNSSINTANINKKIKNYSYNLADRIGKGFSSIVYKGINDTTSNNIILYDVNHTFIYKFKKII
jgi:hypothetical protein